MDMFNEVINKGKVTSNGLDDQELFAKKIEINVKNQLDGQKSDTDSGRSSEHGIEVVPVKSKTPPKPPRKQNYGQNFCVNQSQPAPTPNASHTGILKVSRSSNMIELPSPIYPIDQKSSEVEKEIQEARAKQLQVNRRKRDQIRKRHDYRRNTIDIAQFDLNLGKQKAGASNKLNLSLSKSATNLSNNNEIEENTFNKRIDEMGFKSKSMPKGFFETLRIRRQSSCKEIKDSSMDAKILATGPEFFLNANQGPKLIDITTPKCTQQRTVHILLLSGKKLQITCNPTTTITKQIFECVIKSENLSENFFIGLCALIGGDFVFLPMDLKIYKVAPQLWVNVSKKGGDEQKEATFTLFLRVKFFLPTLRGVSSLESRHLLYLQLRKSVLERQILCTDEDLIALCALALQAEVGDFEENMKYVDYFTISHYLPDGVYQRNKELARYLRNAHYLKKGLHRTEAEHNFIRYLQELKEYGLHLYSAIWETFDNKQVNVYVGISLSGVLLFERNLRNLFKTTPDDNNGSSKKAYQRNVYAHFEWLEIENICHTKHSLSIFVRRNESLSLKDKSRVKYKLKMDGRKSFFAFTLASEHHKFYMKLRNSFVSIKALSEELNISLMDLSGATATQKIELNTATNPVEPISHKSIDKIDKLVKISGLRVRNLKKSMLNDGRLLKLRQKFLRRSKSSVSDLNVIGRGLTLNDSFDQEQHHDVHKSEQQLHTKEESQNKENEHPRSDGLDSPKQNSTMQRNKVKMGTRVISSHLLNRSYDNIYDDPFDRSLSGPQSLSQDLDDSFIEMKMGAGRGLDESQQSLSLESIYNTFEKSKNNLVESALMAHAYVVHSSIKSSCNNSNFTLQHDETISDSLLDKFNNISCSMNDRILKRVTVIKDKNIVDTSNVKNEKNFYQKPASSAMNGDENSIKCGTTSNRLHSMRMAKTTTTATMMTNMKNSILSRSQELITNKNNKLHLATTQPPPPPPPPMMMLKNVYESINANGVVDSAVDGGVNENVIEFNNTNRKRDCANDGYTLGISIVQGTDNNVYVKDMVAQGPGERSGIIIGDQIIAVDGVSLLNLSYTEALKLLQNTGRIVELVLSQVYKPNKQLSHDNQSTHNNCSSAQIFAKPSPTKAKSIQNIFNQSLNEINIEFDQIEQAIKNTNLYDGQYYWNGDAGYHYQADIVNFMQQLKEQEHAANKLVIPASQLAKELSKSNRDLVVPRRAECENFKLTPSKSMPDLPKIVAIIPKDLMKTTLPRNIGQSRKYTGPTRYPVTPCKETIKTKSLLLLPSTSTSKHQLSLLADSNEDETFFI